jgi:hypothetical protein
MSRNPQVKETVKRKGLEVHHDHDYHMKRSRPSFPPQQTSCTRELFALVARDYTILPTSLPYRR